ncbi:MobF family relaxase [Pseudoxanthomonas daejeonensis]|nr:MobF family relaxase [Pseudoxanthomonas daejeonensis]
MLKLTPLTGTGNNARGDNVLEYLHATQSLKDLTGYYIGADLGEDTMRWRGHGAAMLDLLGKDVDKAAMIELAAGFSPDGMKEKLCQNAGKLPEKVLKLDKGGNPRLLPNGHPDFVWKGGHQVGYDCVFNAPKSVSLLLAFATPDERSAILKAHRDAVDQGLEYMESKVETRRGKAGIDVIPVDGLVITSCDHLANRNLEPHLHTHNMLYGVAYADGKWGGWESSELFRHQKAADTIYMAHLAENMRRLGYGIEQQAEVDPDQQDTGVRSWKVAGIDDATIAAFSTRTHEVLEAMTEGLSHQEAWAKTRAHKDEPSPEELFSTWEKVIPAVGQDCNIANLKGRADILATPRSDDEILEALHATTAIVAEKDLLWEVSRARAGQSPEALLADVKRLKESMVEIAPERQAAVDQGVHVSRRYSETRFAWSKIVDWEQDVQARAEARKDDLSVRVPERIVDSVIADYQQEKGFTLSDEQRNAVYHLCSNSGGHAVMAGVAGSGKTTVADLYKRCFEANGQDKLIGACTSRKAAGKLKEESGMEAMSITKLLMKLDNGHKLTKDIPGLTNKSVIVLDEAGMVDTEAVRRLMRHVDEAGGKLILQGDQRQLPAVRPGAGMSLVSEKLGQAELTEIRRQKNAEDRDIAIAFYDRDAQGRIILHNRSEPKSRRDVVAKGANIWKKLEARGAIDAYNTRGEAMDALARDWLDSPHAIDNRLLLVHDYADSQALTEKLREGLRERGALAGDDHTFQGRRDKRLYDMTVAVGDRVRITKNDNDLGVENGDMAQVESITRTATGSLAFGLRVEGKPGQPSFAVAVDTDQWNHLQAGYCRTVHDAQGQGKPAVFHFANARMVDNQSALVAFTRLTSDKYRMYGAEVELEQVKTRLGADRLKQNAVQEGFWKQHAQKRPAPTMEQEYDRHLQQDRGVQR